MGSSEIATVMSFEEKLKGRIRDSIGELLSDEDLTNIVRRGIEGVFFTERRVPDKHGYGPKTIPPLIHQIVKEVLSDRMEAAVEAWLVGHADEVSKAIDVAVVQGAGKAMLRQMDFAFGSDMEGYGESLSQRLGLS